MRAWKWLQTGLWDKAFLLGLRINNENPACLSDMLVVLRCVDFVNLLAAFDTKLPVLLGDEVVQHEAGHHHAVARVGRCDGLARARVLMEGVEACVGVEVVVANGEGRCWVRACSCVVFGIRACRCHA